MRIKILRLIIFALFLLIAINLIYIQLIKGGYFYNLSKNNRIRVVSILGQRGRIFDRNGIILADNRRSFDVMVVPQEMKDEVELFDFLSRSLQIDKKKLLKNYKQKIFESFSPVVVAEDISREMAIVLEENKFRFPGLLVQESFRRFYPQREVSCHVVGYVGKMNPEKIEALRGYGYSPQSFIGYSGVEEFYDRYLRGKEGGLQIEVNSRGEQVRLLSLKEPFKGHDITLTIDQRIQQAAVELLAPARGTIIVMDMDHGAILGMISSPGYDPNIFVENLSAQMTNVFSSSSSPLLNRAISGQYPPGSVFKIPVALGALDSGKIITATTFNCPGYYKLGQREFRCTHVHGDQSLIEAIAHSCNVYFFHVGMMTGVDVMDRYARLLGLGSSTQIDLPFEAKGVIPNRQQKKLERHEAWYPGDTLNFSIGQGDVLATPIQLVHMMSIVAQNGRDVHPHVIKSIAGLWESRWQTPTAKSGIQDFSSDGEQSEDSIPHISDYTGGKNIHINSEKFFAALQVGLAATVTDPSGTANVLNIPGLSVLGKTGTAQTSGNRDYHAWFVGCAASKKIKIAFCVFLEYGGSSYNACVIARDLLLRMQEEGIL